MSGEQPMPPDAFISASEVLKQAEKTYAKGNPVGLIEALGVLIDMDSLPTWAADGLEEALAKYLHSTEHGIAIPFKQYKADANRYQRYWAVRQAMKEGVKGDGKFVRARKILATRFNHHCGLGTIVDDHKAVRAALNTEKGKVQYARFNSRMRPFLMRVLNKGG